MNAKYFGFWAVLLAALPSLCYAPPAMSNRPTNMEDPALRQIRMLLSDLRHELNNHEAEIRTFESKLQTQEITVENLRDELKEGLQAQKDLARAHSVNFEGKTESLDSTLKGVISDMRQIKTQANDSVNVLAQYKQKLSEIEKLIDSQNQYMKGLELALNSIIEALQAKEATEKMLTNKASENSSKTHKVQAGDNLEKIARNYKVSLQALREANQLSNDRIIVGQTLKVP